MHAWYSSPVMQDPPYTQHFDHVRQSDTQIQGSLTSTGATKSSSNSDYGPRVSHSDAAANAPEANNAQLDLAYGVDPHVSTSSNYSARSSHSVSHNTHESGAPLTTTPGFNRVLDSHGSSGLNLATFGSEPWPTASTPYLHFDEQPLYEPTGELVHETIQEFEHFDDPSSFRQSNWQANPINPDLNTASQIATAVPNTTTESNNFRKDAQGFTRPALKRNFVSEGGSEAFTLQNKHQKFSSPDVRIIRRVSFEQMSSNLPISADDEDSSSEEDVSHSRSAASGRLSTQPVRSRGSRTGNVGAQRGQSSGTSARGSRTASGHPPSILPPEKVFPIQIGSELFRLSGASISSDAPSYFTQFFEEQIRQNEESGGVRTLYIDRDPETFRDVARHLQGAYFLHISLNELTWSRLLCATQGWKSFC